MLALIEKMVTHHGLSTRCETGEMFRHIYRELDTEADALAGKAANSGALATDASPPGFLRLMFDGSCKSSKSGGGWILYGAHSSDMHIQASL